jgi:hypothetical protein
MEEIGNPIGTFVEETLIFDPDATVPKDDVFMCYSHWAMKKKLSPGTELAFKRRFLAATQEHRIEIGLDRTNGERNHIYRGIRLNDKAQKHINSLESFKEEGVY